MFSEFDICIKYILPELYKSLIKIVRYLCCIHRDITADNVKDSEISLYTQRQHCRQCFNSTSIYLLRKSATFVAASWNMIFRSCSKESYICIQESVCFKGSLTFASKRFTFVLESLFSSLKESLTFVWKESYIRINSC